MTEQKQYPNHVIPNSYQTPNIMIDILLPLLTDSEWRVLSYAMRHILGWREKIEARKGTISLSMFENGYGPYPGCGLNKGTIIKVLKALDEHGILIKDGGVSKDGQRWQIADNLEQINIEALETRLQNKRSIDKKRTKNMLDGLKQKRAQLLSHNTGGVLSHNTASGMSHNTQLNPPLNPPSNQKDSVAQKQSDAVAADNGVYPMVKQLYNNKRVKIALVEAKVIVKHFRESTFEVLNADPYRLREVFALDRKRADRIAAQWESEMIDDDPTDAAWLERHAVDDKWTKATWVYMSGINPVCDDCSGDFEYGGDYYHNGKCQLCSGCWLKRDDNIDTYLDKVYPDTTYGPCDGCGNDNTLVAGLCVSCQRKDTPPALTAEEVNKPTMQEVDAAIFGTRDKPVKVDELPMMSDVESKRIMQSLDDSFRTDCKRWEGGCKILMKLDNCIECAWFTQAEADEPPPKPKVTKAKKKPTPHTLMKNALVTAMGYKQDDITCWGDYNSASKKLRNAKPPITPEEVATLYKFSCGLAKQGDYKFKSPMQLAKDLPEYRKMKRQVQSEKDTEFTFEEE